MASSTPGHGCGGAAGKETPIPSASAGLDSWRDDLCADTGVLSLGAAGERRQFSKNAIRRVGGGSQRWTKRRISGGSASDSVVVTHCCWVPNPPASSASHTAAPLSYVLCALSDGTLCLMNTLNFFKVYMLEEASSTPSGHDTSSSSKSSRAPPPPGPSAASPRTGARPRILALDCAIPPFASGPQRPARPALDPTPAASGPPNAATSAVAQHRIACCMVLEDGVYTAEVDVLNSAALRSFTRDTGLRRVTGLPEAPAAPPGGNEAKRTASTRAACTAHFSEDRDRILLLAPSAPPRLQRASLPAAGTSAFFLSILQAKGSDGAECLYEVEQRWTPLPAPSPAARPLTCRWWGTDLPAPAEASPSSRQPIPAVLVVWSTGEVDLLQPEAGGGPSSSVRLLARSPLCTAPPSPPPGGRRGAEAWVSRVDAMPLHDSHLRSLTDYFWSSELSAGSKPSSGLYGAGVLAVVCGASNVLQPYTVQVSPAAAAAAGGGSEAPRAIGAKSPREAIATAAPAIAATPYRLRLAPTPRSYCSRDIPISDVRLFFSLSPCLSVVLRSGALLLLDVWGMSELAGSCPVGRLLRVQAEQESKAAGGTAADPLRGGTPVGAGRGPRCVVSGKPCSICIIDHNALAVPERLETNNKKIHTHKAIEQPGHELYLSEEQSDGGRNNPLRLLGDLGSRKDFSTPAVSSYDTYCFACYHTIVCLTYIPIKFHIYIIYIYIFIYLYLTLFIIRRNKFFFFFFSFFFVVWRNEKQKRNEKETNTNNSNNTQQLLSHSHLYTHSTLVLRVALRIQGSQALSKPTNTCSPSTPVEHPPPDSPSCDHHRYHPFALPPPPRTMWGLHSSSSPPSNRGGGGASSAGGALVAGAGYSFIPSSAGSPNSMMSLASLTGAGSGAVIPAVAPIPHDRSKEVCKYFINGGCQRGNCPYLHEVPDERHLDVNGLGFILNPNVQNAQKTIPGTANTPGSLGTTGGGNGASLTTPVSAAAAGQSSNGGSGRQGFHGSSAAFGKSAAAGKQPQPSPAALQQTAAGLYTSGVTHTLPATLPTSILKSTPPPRYRPPEPYLEHNLPPVLVLPIKSSTRDVARMFMGTMFSGTTAAAVGSPLRDHSSSPPQQHTDGTRF
eukprot:gene8846-6227_t